MVLGGSWCLHTCHGPFQEWLEPLPPCTSLGWAQQLCPASIYWVSAEQIGAHAFGISRRGCFLSQVSNLCWKGAPCFNLTKTSYFMHVVLLLQQSPSFSWDFKMPWIYTGYQCGFPEGTPCSKAPHVSQHLSSHCGLPVSQLGQEQLPGCHWAGLQGIAVSVRKLRFCTATWPWHHAVAVPSCRCCAQRPLPQQAHLTSVLWAAVAEAAGSALLVISREKWALSGAMHLTPIGYLLLHRVNYILRAPIDSRSSPEWLVQTQTCEMNPTPGAWCQYLSI